MLAIVLQYEVYQKYFRYYKVMSNQIYFQNGILFSYDANQFLLNSTRVFYTSQTFDLSVFLYSQNWI